MHLDQLPAELVMLILSHLARERIDLLAVSQVSKALRDMALPVLVRTLEIPLSRIDAYKTLFDAHPELHQHVRFVRIVDDRVQDWLREEQAEMDVRREETIQQWLQLERFVADRWLNVKLDITSGIMAVGGLATFLRGAKIAQNVVATRWTSDYLTHQYTDVREADEDIVPNHMNEARAQAITSVYATHWAQVSEVMKTITDAQTSSEIKLVSLQIRQEQLLRDTTEATVWSMLSNLPSTDIHTLSIFDLQATDRNSDTGFLFDRVWPSLRHLDLMVSPHSGSGREVPSQLRYRNVESWISEHLHLQSFRALFWRYTHQLLLENEFPDLTAIRLNTIEHGPTGDFLLRHGHKLVKLELPTCYTHDDLTAVIRPGLRLPKLRILRAGPRVVAALTDGPYAPQLVHIEIRWPYRQSIHDLEKWIFRSSEAAHHLTCLHIEEAEWLNLDEVTRIISRSSLLLGHLCSLVELCLSGLSPPRRWDCIPQLDFCFFRNLLGSLEGLPSLRALRIKGHLQRPFPTSEPIELSIGRTPRKLEYLTWEDGDKFQRAQYYRLSHRPIHYAAERTETSLRLPPVLLKIQPLPASFRTHITDEGEWIQTDKHGLGNSIFDHTVSPPRLRYQPGTP